MWISKSDWRRHARELSKAERRAEEAERFSRELINRWLTKNGSMGISAQQTSSNAIPPNSVPRKPEMVGGVTEDEFIEDLTSAGMGEGEARQRWKQAQEVGILPYQMEGELPS